MKKINVYNIKIKIGFFSEISTNPVARRLQVDARGAKVRESRRHFQPDREGHVSDAPPARRGKIVQTPGAHSEHRKLGRKGEKLFAVQIPTDHRCN